MTEPRLGRTLLGSDVQAQRALDAMQALPVDENRMNDVPAPLRRTRCTIKEPVTVTGPGTFFGRETRTVAFYPSERAGWWFDRSDLPGSLPVEVSIHNVWTTGQIVSNIVLRSGSPHNYIRLVEHIIALRMGMEIDDLVIRIDSGDPPLFDVGSMPLVEALERQEKVDTGVPLPYVTVREPVSIVTDTGKLLVFEPVDPARPGLFLDVAIDFASAIGKQRIQFPVNTETFRRGAHARTNTTARKKLYCQTLGKVFADIRNLGYTNQNVLIAGRRRYWNTPEPSLNHGGRSLEAVWHRAVLDLLAAIALIERGAFLGTVRSFKAGHGLDVEAINLLYQRDLLEPITF